MMIIIIKTTRHTELGKTIPPINHDTKQDIGQQKYTEIKKRKLSKTISKHKFIALLKELSVPPLNTPDDSKFHRRTAAGRNNRLNWSVL